MQIIFRLSLVSVNMVCGFAGSLPGMDGHHGHILMTIEPRGRRGFDYTLHTSTRRLNLLSLIEINVQLLLFFGGKDNCGRVSEMQRSCSLQHVSDIDFFYRFCFVSLHFWRFLQQGMGRFIETCYL